MWAALRWLNASKMAPILPRPKAVHRPRATGQDYRQGLRLQRKMSEGNIRCRAGVRLEMQPAERMERTVVVERLRFDTQLLTLSRPCVQIGLLAVLAALR